MHTEGYDGAHSAADRPPETNGRKTAGDGAAAVGQMLTTTATMRAMRKRPRPTRGDAHAGRVHLGDAGLLYFAGATGATRAALILGDIGTLEDPITPDFLPFDCSLYGQLAHAADSHAEGGGDFCNVHEFDFSLHTIECTYPLPCTTLLHAI